MKLHFHIFELGTCGCVPSTVRLVQRVAIQGLLIRRQFSWLPTRAQALCSVHIPVGNV